MSRSDRMFYAVTGSVLTIITASALSGAVVALISPEFLDGLRTTDHPVARRPRLFGTILLLSAAALAWQMLRTTRNGFLYCWLTEKICRAGQPRLYRLWFVVHLLFVVTTAGWSAVAFLL